MKRGKHIYLVWQHAPKGAPPIIPASWCSCPCVNLSPCIWAGPGLPANPNNLAKLTECHYCVCYDTRGSILLADSLQQLSLLPSWTKGSCWESPQDKNLQLTSKNYWQPSATALSPTQPRELIWWQSEWAWKQILPQLSLQMRTVWPTP